MSLLIEQFANAHADSSLRPLEASKALGPVLATPSYAAYGAGVAVAFTLGIISDAVGHTEADEFGTEGLENGASADQLIHARVANLR